MKRIIQISLLFSSIVSYGQTDKTSTIKLSTGDCRKNEAYSLSLADTIRFYKLPEDSLAFKIIPGRFTQWPITIKNAQTGNYRLTYKNNFDQQITEQISVAEQAINEIVICPDKLAEYPQNTLEKLRDKDTISINFHSQGCFHTEALKLKITKETGRFVARLYKISWYGAKKKGKATLVRTVTMTEQNIQDFTRFENELNYLKDGYCTTTDWYNIRSKYLNIKKTDGSCSWDGFYFLQKSFFEVVE